MPDIKQNQIAQFTLLAVDKTDFATVESGVTSNFTQRLWGLRHGDSAAATAKTPSKTPSVVRSGVLRITLKANEVSTFDRIHYQLTHASCADQNIVFNVVVSDDSDIASALTVIQSMASDAASAAQQANSRVLLNQSRISDIYSLLSDAHSDLRSYLIGVSATLSDVYSLLSDTNSDLASKIGGITATVSASDISDIASAVWAHTIGARVDSRVLIIQSLASDVDSALTSRFSNLESLLTTTGIQLNASTLSDIRSAITVVQSMASDAASAAQQASSRILVVQSRVSDVESALDSQFVYLSNALSDLQSDLTSQIGGITVTLSASNISDIASAVDETLASRLSDILSAAQQVNSRVLLNQSRISDVYSLLSDFNSNFDSRVPKEPAARSQLSDLSSDLLSYLVGLSATLSGTYSGVQLLESATIGKSGSTSSQVTDPSTVEIAGITHDGQYDGYYFRVLSGSQIDELRLVVDTNATTSHLVLKPAFGSRLLSGIDYILLPGNPYQSKIHSDVMSRVSDVGSDLRSYLVGLSASLSDVQSAVTIVQSMSSDAASAAQQGNSRVLLVLSNVSDVQSAVALVQSMASDAASAAQQANSRILVVQSRVSDVESALDSQFVYLSNAISDLGSDLGSKIGNISVTLTASDISDIASAVAEAVTTITASDISDIASAVNDILASRLSDILSAAQQTNSRTLVVQSLVSDVDSALTSRFSNLESLLTTTGVQLNVSTLSDIRSAITAGGAATITASDISDIASAVWAAKYTAHSVASSFGSLLSDLFSRATLTQSMASDAASAAQQTNSRVLLVLSNVSDVQSVVTVIQSMTSDAASAAQQASSRILVVQSRVSDIESALDSQFTYLSNILSDLQSVVTVTGVQLNASSLSDLRSAISANSLSNSDISNIASRVWSEKYATHSLASSFGSLFSVVATNAASGSSRALINQSRISDVQSLLSDLQSDFQSRVPKAVATNSQLSDLASDLRSYMVATSAMLSDVESQLDATTATLSDFYSDFQSRVPKRVATDSQLSDLHSNISARIPAALSTDGYIKADVLSVGANTTAATNLRQTLIGVRTFTAASGTLSTTQCTTDLTIDNDDLNGRILTWLTGNNAGVQTEITDSASASGLLTFTAIPQAVQAGDTGVIT